MRALERGIQPAFSGKCPVQVNQVSITETMLDEAREESQQIGAPTLPPQGRRTDCRRAQLWSETEKCGHLLTALESLRPDCRTVQHVEHGGERIDQEAFQKAEGVPNAGSRGSRRNPKA